MDLLTAANLIIAYVAIVSLLIYGQYNSRTLRMLQKQTNFLRAQQAPFLRVEWSKFKGNQIRLKLRNLGNGAAIELGILTSVYPAYVMYTDKNGRKLSKEEFEEIVREKQRNKLYGIFQPHPIRHLNYEGKKIRLDDGVNFLQEKNYSPSYFEPKRGSKEYSQILKFGARYESPKEKEDGAYAKIFEYPELGKVLLENKIEYLAIELSLLYKDQVGIVQLPQRIGKYTAYLKVHKTIEDVVKAGQTFQFTPLLKDEIERLWGFQFEEEYRTSWWPLSIPERES